MKSLTIIVTSLWLIVLGTAFGLRAEINPPVTKSTHYRTEVADFYGLSSAKNLTLLPVRGYQQTTNYTCGPAAIMSLMHYYGMLQDSQMTSTTELKIAREMGISDNSPSTMPKMVSWLEEHGFIVKYGEKGNLAMLRENLHENIPTLVEWVDWGGHWDVVTGYNVGGEIPRNEKDTILFADPSAHFDNVKYIDGITTFNPDRFASMWFDAKYGPSGHLIEGIYIVAVPKKLISK